MDVGLCYVCIDHHYHESIASLCPYVWFLYHVAPMSHVDVTNDGIKRSCNLSFSKARRGRAANSTR